MSHTRPMPKRFKLLALMAALLLAFSAQPAVAQFQAATTLNSSLGGLNTQTGAEATSSNVSLLQARVSQLQTQLAATSSTAEAAQLQAVITALQNIVSRLQAGLNLTGYDVTSDESTLETKITATFTDAAGSTTTLITIIPPLEDYIEATTASSDDSSDSSSSSGIDLLTQILQQVGLQLGGTSSGVQNPLSAVQSTLNNLVNNNGASGPVQQMTEALKQAVNAALQCTNGGTPTAGNGVAVYDITAQKLYMPDGTVLEAHSGTGMYKDNPAYVNVKGKGSTPPGVYNLTMRQGLFYGEEAVRMNPTSSTQMYGRDGILVHRPLRAGGGSAGCTVLPEYEKFLAAFKRGEVKQIVVVSSVAEANAACEVKRPPQYDTSTPQSQSGL